MPAPYKTVLIFGGPGVGKGTQGQILGTIPGFHHCASGDLFRSVDTNTDLGRIFHQYSSCGKLVPDDVTIGMWHQAMEARIAAKQFNPDRDLLMLDGLPRTVEQAKLTNQHIDVLKIIHLVCRDQEVMVQRLRGRALKLGRKDDADEKVIRNRWVVYETETCPLLGQYAAEKVAEVDAVATPAQVLSRILTVVTPIQEANFPAFDG